MKPQGIKARLKSFVLSDLGLFDVDQWIIYTLMFATLGQEGRYLESLLQGQGWGLGFLQAAVIDAAVWRCSVWLRRFTGAKQRRAALAGVLFFSLASVVFNYGYYTRFTAEPPLICAALAIFLPSAIGLLSYLRGVRLSSAKFGDEFAERRRSAPHRAEKAEESSAIISRPVQPAVLGALPTTISMTESVLSGDGRDENMMKVLEKLRNAVGGDDFVVSKVLPQLGWGETYVREALRWGLRRGLVEHPRHGRWRLRTDKWPGGDGHGKTRETEASGDVLPSA